MVGQGLRRSLHKEGQEGELRAVLGQERVLRASAKRSNLGDVDLNDSGQLGGGLQRLHHAAGDRLTQTRHLLGRATQRRGLADSFDLCGGSRSRSRRGGSSTSGCGGSLNILAAHAATDAGARHSGQVNAEVAGKLTHDRCHVDAAGCGGRRRNDGSASCGGSQSRHVRERIDGSGRSSRSGRRSRSSRGGRCSRSGRSGRRSRSSRGDRSSRSSRGDRSSRGRRWSSLGDDRDDRADLDGLVLGHADLREETCDGSRNLGVHLVGGDLKQRLVGIDGVAHGLQPRGDGALGDGLAQGGHAYLGALSGRGGRSSRSSCHGSCRGGGRSSSGGRGLGRVANARDLGADLDGLILGNQDLEEDAGDGGRNLGVNLVGGHLNDGLVEFDGIADLLEPRRNGALGDGLAQSGHSH